MARPHPGASTTAEKDRGLGRREILRTRPADESRHEPRDESTGALLAVPSTNMARSIWSGTISFGHIDNIPHQNR